MAVPNKEHLFSLVYFIVLNFVKELHLKEEAHTVPAAWCVLHNSNDRRRLLQKRS